jgi:hypothetical protein
MLPLKFRWAWWSLGWLLVAGVCAGSLIPGEHMPTISVSDKLLHGGAYLLLMVWFGGLYRRGRHIWIAAALMMLGFSLDSLQGVVTSRNFDLFDIGANGGGILLGWLLSATLLEGWCHRIERLFVA